MSIRIARPHALGAVAATLALAAAAYAQPAATDLGTLPEGETRVNGIAVSGSSIVWYQFMAPAVSNADNRYLDIWTEAAGGDSELGLYDSTGTRIAIDDDDGDSLRSALSFGATSPARPLTGGVAHNGRDGNLAAGLYYLALGNFNTTFNEFTWDVFSSSTANNTFDLVLSVGTPPPPPPDRWNETGDAGEFPTTAQVPSGSGNLGSISGSIATGGEVDMFEIEICDVANFTATTTGTGTTMDTQLWLFLADGSGVVFNDDTPPGGVGLQSTLSSAFITGPGQYYLAISGYNNDPNDEFGQLMWLNTPFNAERAPDGPGAAGTLSSWTGGGASGTYLINLTGACFPGGGGCAPCAADFDQSGGVDGDDITAFFNDWQAGAPCGDVDGSGGVDGDDIPFFFDRWQAGGCP